MTEKCHTQSVSKKSCPTVGRKDSEQKLQKAREKFHYRGNCAPARKAFHRKIPKW